MPPEVEALRRMGNEVRRGGDEGSGRDNVCLATCWDELEQGGRDTGANVAVVECERFTPIPGENQSLCRIPYTADQGPMCIAS